MRKLMYFFVIVVFLSGCSSASRVTRLKNRAENVVTVEVRGTIQEAKKLIKETASELKLIERPAAETETFLLISTNKFKGGVISAVSGGFGTMAYYTCLGFFFDYNRDKDITTVTISEEVSSFGEPRRFIFVDKIKLKQLESVHKNE